MHLSIHFSLIILLNSAESFHNHLIKSPRISSRIILCSAAFNLDLPRESEYSYLDSGNCQRLEKFGPVIVCRSCPAATWASGLSHHEWGEASVIFDTSQSSTGHNVKKNLQRGQWTGIEHIPSDWRVRFDAPGIEFSLSASENGQVRLHPKESGLVSVQIRTPCL